MAKTITHDQIYEDDIWKPFIDGLEKAIEKTTALKETLKSTTDGATKTANATGSDDYESINKKTKAIQDGIDAAKKYQQVEKEVTNAEKMLADALKQQKVAQIQANQETKEAKRIMELQVKIANTLEGSYDNLSAQYSINKLLLNGMTKEMREGTEEGQKLEKQTYEIYQEMKKLQEATGKHVLSVGDYKQATGEVTKSLGEMKQELRSLKNMSFAGKTSEEIDEVKQKMAGLIDDIGDMQMELNTMAQQKDTFAGVLTGLTLVSAGVEGVVSSLSLLGVESETLDVLEGKMMQLIALTQALSEIEDAYRKGKIKAIGLKIKETALTVKDNLVKWSSTVATVAQTKAETAKTVAVSRGSIVTRTAAAVQWLWNAALAANPIGLVIIGIAALTAGIIALTLVMKDSGDEQERLNKLLDENAKKREEQEKWDALRVRTARAVKQSEEDLLKIEKEALVNKLASIEAERSMLQQLQVMNELTDEQSERKLEIDNEILALKDDILVKGLEITMAQKDANDEQKKADEEARKKAQEKLDLLKKQRLEYEKFYLDTFSNIAKENLESEEKRIENSNYANKRIIEEAKKMYDIYEGTLVAVYKKEREQALNEKELSRWQRLKIEAEYNEKIRVLGNERIAWEENVNDKMFASVEDRFAKQLEAEKKHNQFKENLTITKAEEQITDQMEILEAMKVTNEKELEAYENKVDGILGLIDKRKQAELTAIDEEEQRLLTEERLNENNATNIARIEAEAIEKRRQVERDAWKEKVEMDDNAEKLAAEKRKEWREKENKELAKNIENAITLFESYYEERNKKRQEALDKEIEASKKQQDILRELASKGVENASDNLAFEQKKQAELQLKKEKLQRQEKLMQLQLTALQTYAKKVEAGEDNPVGATIKDITVLSGFMKSLSSFFDGTEDTGLGGKVDNKGGFLSVLHPHERVLTADQNKMLAGLSNWELANIGAMHKKGASSGDNELSGKIDKLISIIDEKPVYLGRDYDATERAIIDVVKKGTTTIRNHKKVSSVW
jgi:hypothetical protein